MNLLFIAMEHVANLVMVLNGYPFGAVMLVILLFLIAALLWLWTGRGPGMSNGSGAKSGVSVLKRMRSKRRSG